MSGGFVGSNGGENPLVTAVGKLAETARELGKPDGAQIHQHLKEIQKLVADLQQQVNNLVNEQTYDRATIDQKDREVYGASARAEHGHDQADIGGVWDKSVSTPNGAVTAAKVTGGEVYAQSVDTNITATRVAVWARTADGFIGTASSSRSLKTNIQPAQLDPARVLQVQPVHYEWRSEAAKRDDPTSPAYVGPEYHVPTEVGMIAEDVHAAGLWEFVVYERNPDGTLRLDDNGEGIPQGIHYTNWGVALQAVVREQQRQIDELRTRLDG